MCPHALKSFIPGMDGFSLKQALSSSDSTQTTNSKRERQKKVFDCEWKGGGGQLDKY